MLVLSLTWERNRERMSNPHYRRRYSWRKWHNGCTTRCLSYLISVQKYRKHVHVGADTHPWPHPGICQICSEQSFRFRCVGTDTKAQSTLLQFGYVTVMFTDLSELSTPPGIVAPLIDFLCTTSRVCFVDLCWGCDLAWRLSGEVVFSHVVPISIQLYVLALFTNIDVCKSSPVLPNHVLFGRTVHKKKDPFSESWVLRLRKRALPLCFSWRDSGTCLERVVLAADETRTKTRSGRLSDRKMGYSTPSRVSFILELICPYYSSSPAVFPGGVLRVGFTPKLNLTCFLVSTFGNMFRRVWTRFPVESSLPVGQEVLINFP